MFGFATVNIPDLSEDEKLRYRAVYCGLCHELSRRSGQASRLSVNHDLVFCALVRLSLYEPEEVRCTGRCAVHPASERTYIQNDEIAYAADMTIALMHGKCADDWNDDGSIPARVYGRVLRRPYEAVRERWPRQCTALEQGLARIDGLERQAAAGRDVGPDEAARAFGAIMAEIMVREEDFWAEGLRRFGFELGRAIYLIDAAVDRADDERTGSYNPFSASGLDAADMRAVVGDCLARTADAFERLPLVQDAHLMRSALYAGMWARVNDALADGEEQRTGAPSAQVKASPCTADAVARGPVAKGAAS
jgi:hypothetical protein